MLTRVLNTLTQVPGIDGVVITYPDGSYDAFADAVPAPLPYRIHMVPGGPSRQASVLAGLQVIEAQTPQAHVLIHDAARPLTPAKVFQELIEHLENGVVAVTAALAVTDTVKVVRHAPNDLDLVLETPLRSSLRAVQTPQGFDLGRLIDAHRKLAAIGQDESVAAPDDCAIMEAADYPVRVTPGDQVAFKVTTKIDLALANQLAREMQQ